MILKQRKITNFRFISYDIDYPNISITVETKLLRVKSHFNRNSRFVECDIAKKVILSDLAFYKKN